LRVRALREPGGRGACYERGAFLQKAAAAFCGARRLTARCIADCLFHAGLPGGMRALFRTDARQDSPDASSMRALFHPGATIRPSDAKPDDLDGSERADGRAPGIPFDLSGRERRAAPSARG